jgi:hypothetical protein
MVVMYLDNTLLLGVQPVAALQSEYSLCRPGEAKTGYC